MAKKISENKLNKLLELNKKLVGENDNSKRMVKLSDTIKDVLSVDKCVVFMHDEQSNSFWSVSIDGISFLEVPADTGIIGKTFETKETVIINDVQSSTLFSNVIDEQIGYHSKNIMVMPVFGYDKQVIGVILLLNKTDGSEGFGSEDEKVLNYLVSHISAYLEVMMLER